MDERLEQAIESSNFLITLENSKRVLKEQYKESLVCYHNKGQFSISMELISYLQTLIGMNQTETVLIDDHDIPIQIENLKLFVLEVMNQFYNANNKYLIEYNKLVKKRSTKDIVEV